MTDENLDDDREMFDYIGQPLAVNDLCIIADVGKNIQIGRIVRFTNKMVVLKKLKLPRYGRAVDEVMSYAYQLVKLSDEQAVAFKLALKYEAKVLTDFI